MLFGGTLLRVKYSLGNDIKNVNIIRTFKRVSYPLQNKQYSNILGQNIGEIPTAIVTSLEN